MAETTYTRTCMYTYVDVRSAINGKRKRCSCVFCNLTTVTNQVHLEWFSSLYVLQFLETELNGGKYDAGSIKGNGFPSLIEIGSKF